MGWFYRGLTAEKAGNERAVVLLFEAGFTSTPAGRLVVVTTGWADNPANIYSARSSAQVRRLCL